MPVTEVIETKRVRPASGGRARVGVRGGGPVPVIKWAGGKRQLVPVLLSLMPRRFEVYHEPFVGGGAVFFELRRSGRLSGPAVLADANERLLTLYRVIRDDTEALIAELETLAGGTSREHYDSARREFNQASVGSSVRTAALFVYLNRLCFNGLFRVNSRGEFNVPYGRTSRVDVVRAPVLWAAAEAFQGVELECQDFEQVLARAGKGDVVYLDPPYAPVSLTSYFTAYAGEFGFDEQIRLAEACRDLDARGVRFILSNSAHPELLKLYRGFEIERVRARRAINSVADRRGEVEEIVVRNFSC